MDRAVILARGVGTRMRKADPAASLDPAQATAAESGVKAMIPIGRPFLDYVLSALADAGFRRVCLVIGPEHDAVRQYYAGLQPRRVQIAFAVQAKPLGTADAVAAAEEFAGQEPFLVLNSDNYYPLDALVAMRQARGSAVVAFDREGMLAGSNVPAERLMKFAALETDSGGHLVRIIEKPDDATLNSLSRSWEGNRSVEARRASEEGAHLPTEATFLAGASGFNSPGIAKDYFAGLSRPIGVGMNCWRFGPTIFQACRAIAPSPRGELEITDAVQYAVDRLGEPFHVIWCKSAVLDLSSRGDIEPVAARLARTEVNL